MALLAVAPACQQRDPLFCGEHMDDPRCTLGDAGGLPEGFVVISGTVHGLTGSGLVLKNNGGDDKLVASDGSFAFATPIMQGSMYDVTVSQQPTNPSEMCMVANGSGTANSDVTDIDVTCTPATYTVGGTAAGLSKSITLTNNGGDQLTVPGSGTFTFAMPLASGQMYDVEISDAQGQTCNASANMGSVGSGPVTTVVIVCGTNLFTVGGNPMQGGGVTGLNGTVKLNNKNGNNTVNDTIMVSSNGAFAFPTPLPGGGGAGTASAYNVTVAQQPSYPPAAQNCVPTMNTGTVGGSNVTNVKITCTTRTFAIGGNVTGLTSGTLVLKNGGDTKSITADGNFTFGTPVASGSTYGVTVMTQPSGHQCTVSMGSGTVTNNDITNVSVSCIQVGTKCGSNFCGSSQVCCNPGSSSATCASSCSSGTLYAECDSRADCSSNKVCCAERHQGNLNVQSITCESSCSNVNNPLQVCDPNKNECSGGKSCQPWSQVSGYYACQ